MLSCDHCDDIIDIAIPIIKEYETGEGIEWNIYRKSETWCLKCFNNEIHKIKYDW